MASNERTYDALLQFQALASFNLERPLFEFDEWHSSNIVIDIGCGNAAFTVLLAREFPEKQFIGVDPNSDLLDFARHRGLPPNVSLVAGKAEDWPSGDEADVLIARLSMMYMNDRLKVIDHVRQSQIKAAVITDADDELFVVRPSLPLFAQVLASIRTFQDQLGGERDLREATPREWREGGFTMRWLRPLAVTSGGNWSNRLLVHHLMRLSAEFVLGCSAPAELLNEIFDWSLADGAYLQYGLRAHLFIRE